LTFTNPLYEAVEVMVETLDPLDMEEGDKEENPREEQDSRSKEVSSTKPAETAAEDWNITMPTTSFGINAFAEEWEYEGEDDEDGDVGAESDYATRGRKYGPGILAKKANKTAVQLDLSVGRDASGQVIVPLYITYTYTAEDPLASGGNSAKGKFSKNDRKALESKQEGFLAQSSGNMGVLQSQVDGITSNLKSFSFWVKIPLGRVVPRVGGGGSTLNVVNPQARRVASTNNLRRHD
jgi:dynactin-4